MKLKFIFLSLFMELLFNVNAKIEIKHISGWLESCYIKWFNDSQYDNYHVYYRPTNGNYTKLDDELVRNYGSFGRADAIGLSEGNYQLKIIPVKIHCTFIR